MINLGRFDVEDDVNCSTQMHALQSTTLNSRLCRRGDFIQVYYIAECSCPSQPSCLHVITFTFTDSSANQCILSLPALNEYICVISTVNKVVEFYMQGGWGPSCHKATTWLYREHSLKAHQFNRYWIPRASGQNCGTTAKRLPYY